MCQGHNHYLHCSLSATPCRRPCSSPNPHPTHMGRWIASSGKHRTRPDAPTLGTPRPDSFCPWLLLITVALHAGLCVEDVVTLFAFETHSFFRNSIVFYSRVLLYLRKMEYVYILYRGLRSIAWILLDIKLIVCVGRQG